MFFAVNCSVAMLEVKPSGANCHLQTCYPTELCVFTRATEYLSYDRTLFVPKEAYNVSVDASTEDSTNTSATVTESLLPSHRDSQHDSVIKPRKGVGPPPELPIEGHDTHSHGGEDANVPTSSKRKIPVGTIFVYAAIILCVLALLAFLGQKFLDCWERRHYTRADYLLDGMYEDSQHMKGNSPSY